MPRSVLRRRGTYRDALDHAEIVIQEWIEAARDLGREIPPPKGRLKFA